MKEIEKNALNMAKALKTNKLVSEVYHPALPHTRNHKIWKEILKVSTGYSHLHKEKIFKYYD
jgi:Cystathionine beta-lyases/cystathionine gamma-synthases